jgi:hypothetical protein
VGIHAEVNRNRKKVTKRYAAIHTKSKRYTTSHQDRLELKRRKIERKS